MLNLPLDLRPFLAPGEEERGYWDVSLAAHEGQTLYGEFLVSTARLLFHARQDHTHKGDWLEIAHMKTRFNPEYPPMLQRYAVVANDTAYLSIPRAHVTRVELLRGFLDRSVRLTLGAGYLITLSNAGFNAKKIVAALS